jgi:glycosyltransferase involved in cell wall biosynthesis
VKRVAIIQSLITDYRAPFYLGLQRRLLEADIALTVWASRSPVDGGWRDSLDALPFAAEIRKTRLGAKAYWQSGLAGALAQDLVIVEQANAALLNYALFASRGLRRRPARVAFWGHGATFQPDQSGPLRAALKRAMTHAADHWFAYTPASRDRVAATGYPAEQITTVYNSVDTAEVTAARLRVEAQGKPAARRRLGLPLEGPVAVFCSRLYPGKKLDLLIDACRLARRDMPDLTLAVIGEGPLSSWLWGVADSEPWIRPMGALYGEAKADVLAVGDLFVMPGLIGLSILDGFAAGLPCLTTASGNHSPEIDYLQPGSNGLVTQSSAQAFAGGLASLLQDPQARARMSKTAIATAATYTIDRMVSAFSAGIRQAVDAR